MISCSCRLAAILVALGLSASAALAERVTLNAAAVPTPMPRTFSTSTWPFNPLASRTLQDWFFANFEPGLIQVDLGEEVFAKSVSADDALVRAETVAAFLERVQAHGGRSMISISKIPPWLSSNPDRSAVDKGEGTSVASASPPADSRQWAGFVQDVARTFSGLDQLSFSIGWEPDTRVWQGTEAEFFDFYDTTARALSQVFPSARIGGPGVSDLGPHWRNPDGQPMLASFLKHVSSSGAPLDFVNVHAFSTSPWASWQMYRSQVSALAVSAGLSSDIPIFVGEWSDRPDPFSPLREEPYIAAYLISNLIGMAEAGIADHSYTSLSEQQIDERTEFSGGLGLFTRSLLIRPAGIAFMMVGRVGDQRLPVTVKDGSVFALAGKRGSTTTLLIANYVPDETIATKDYIDRVRRQGLLNDRLARALKSGADLRALALGDARPNGNSALAAAHDIAKAGMSALRKIWAEGTRPVDITLAINGLAGGAADEIRVIRIDSAHGVVASAGKEIDRKIESARRELTDAAKLEALRRDGIGDDDLNLLQRFAGAGDRSAFVRGLDRDQFRRLLATILTLTAIEDAVGLPIAQAALDNPATGFTVSQSVSIAGKKDLTFDIRMEPNSVVLLEFGG